MSCVIEEFPLLPFEPVPRGETLAHWRNEIAEWAEGLQPLICRETPEVDLSGINQAVADFNQLMEDFENRLPPFPYTPLGIVYAPDAVNLGQISIGTANQVLGVNSAGTGYEYKTIAGTASQIGVTHGAGTITLTLLAHAASHMSAGTDPIRIDELKIGTDVTTLNATTTEHGLLRKLSGNAAQFLAGDGTWGTPSGLTPGTVNYFPKWTAGAPYLSSTSLVYDNGTNVGINVGASPLATLHVASNTAAGVTGTNIQLRLTDTTNTARSLLLGWDQANAAGYIQATVVGSSADTIQLNPAGGLVTVGSGGLRLEASATFGWHTDVKFVRSAAGVVHMRDGANPQVLYVFNSFTSGAVYEGLFMGWSGNVAYVYTETPGGAAPRELRVGTYGAIGVSFMTNNTVRWQVNGSGHLVLGLDVTYNIGAAAQRVNDVYIGGNLYFSGVSAGYLKGNGTSAVSSVSAIPQADVTNLVSDLAGKASTTHASTHMSAGSDPIRIDELKVGTDVTTLNATATEHGLLKKLSGNATDFMNGAGNWAIPAGTGVTSVSGTAGRISSTGGTTPVLDLIATAVTPATYGSASVVPVLTVDAYGRLTSVVDTAIAISAAAITSGTLPVGRGGTGATTLTGMLQGNGTSAVDAIIGTADVLPKWAASAPYLADSLLHSGTNLVEQYNSTNAQAWSLYGTRTSGSVYERLTITHTGSASGITITSEAAGGGTARNMSLNADAVLINGKAVVTKNFTDPATTEIACAIATNTNTITANNSQVIIGLSMNARINQNGFNFTATTGLRGLSVSALSSGASGRTTAVIGLFMQAGNVGAGDLSNAYGVRVDSALNSGGGTLDVNNCIYIREQTAGTTIYGVRSLIAAAANRWNLYMEGTADNYLAGNLGIGTSTFGASMLGGMAMKNGTAPTGGVTDCFQMYSADIVAGNAAPHFRTENGAVVKLFQDTGWTLPTGTASKAGFATGTATLTQLAQTLKAVMDHLMTGAQLFAA